jgi:bile acid-coenzyme A ligase
MSPVSYGRALALWAERDPDAPALRCGGEVRTRGAFDRRANALARAFAARGVGEGDLVTLALPNGIAFLEACLAVWRLGATPNPVSPLLPERERHAIVELADPALVLGVPAGSFGERPCLPVGFEPGPEHAEDPLPDVVSERVRCMTSGGSTGRPKLILEKSRALCDPDAPENGMVAEGTTLVAGPLYHAGPFITCWQQLLCGGCVVVMERFEPSQALALVERHRIHWALFVPTMLHRIWRLPAAERAARNLSSLVRVTCTGAPCPAWLMRAWIDWLGPERIFEAYGGSERIAGTLISGSEWLAHPGSVGKPTGERRIRILREDGSECAPGEQGELFMLPPGGRGSTYAYIGAEARATSDGWESLGDMGWLDEDGYLYLTDRKTDMIVCGGANVYPAEIEAALEAHPAVRSSAVVGLPDPDLGQRIHAIVDAVAPVEADVLRAHLAEQLVRYKIPKSFEFVCEPLRDDAGKLRRSALRAARLDAPPEPSA